MKLLFILDQIQAGFGGKEHGDLPLGGKKMALGSVDMFNNALKAVDGEVIATLYCGDDFFLANREEVVKKLTVMSKKLAPDVVICAPAFNYEKYGLMCGQAAAAIQQAGIPTVAAMSVECEEAIATYKDQADIIKMPKKGGIGLTDALQKVLTLAKLKYENQDTAEFVSENCY